MGAAESHTAKKQVNVDEAKEFFSAKLVVGGDDKPETLLPISYWKEASEDEEATATFAYYCAEPGVKFQVKCALLRPPPEGVSYGARVYVDRGEPDTVYTSAAVEGCVEINQCIGCYFSAMTRSSWLGRAVRNQHRHAIEQASRRWRGGHRQLRARRPARAR